MACHQVSLNRVAEDEVAGGDDEGKKKGLRSNDVEVDEYDSDLDEVNGDDENPRQRRRHT
jgi:hypothetical protein